MKHIPSRLCLQAVVKGVFRGEVCPISSWHTQIEHLLYPGIGSGDPGQKEVESAPTSEPLPEEMHTPLYAALQELCAFGSKPQGVIRKENQKIHFSWLQSSIWTHAQCVLGTRWVPGHLCVL